MMEKKKQRKINKKGNFKTKTTEKRKKNIIIKE